MSEASALLRFSVEYRYQTAVTDRYYIRSNDAGADGFCKIIRNYWSIENADFSPTALGA